MTETRLTPWRSLLALPQEVMARPGMVDRILEIAGTHEVVVRVLK